MSGISYRISRGMCKLVLVSCLLFVVGCARRDKPIDWGDYDVLKQKPRSADPPSYGGKQVSHEDYIQ